MRRFEERFGVTLGCSPSTLAKCLHGLSFAELEQFGLDMQRRYVLELPDGDVRAIVRERMKQWRKRAAAAHQMQADDGDA